MKLSISRTVTIQPEVRLDLQKEMQFWSDRFVARQNGRYITASSDWLQAQPVAELETRFAAEESILRSAVLKTIEYLFRRRRKSLLRILEVGIGGGFLTDTLLQTGRLDYVGLDISPAILAHHMERLAIVVPDIPDLIERLCFGSVTHLTKKFDKSLPAGVPEQKVFKSRSFDFVVCGEVLHRVEGWSAALDEIQKVLRPGGVLIGYEPLRENNSFDVSPTGAVLKSSSDYQLRSDFNWLSHGSDLPQNVTFCGQVHTIYALQRA